MNANAYNGSTGIERHRCIVNKERLMVGGETGKSEIKDRDGDSGSFWGSARSGMISLGQLACAANAPIT
jgi:hypothetical protein